MKYIKSKLIVIRTLIISAIFLVVMWNIKWKPLYEMTELGYLEVEPVGKATKEAKSSEGYPYLEHYVVVEVDTADGVKECTILISQAYDKDDSEKRWKDYQSNQKVAGYYFYVESKGEILFSKDHTTAKEYMESKAILVVIAVLALNIIFIIAAILSSVTGRLGSGDLPKGGWSRDQMVVCRMNTFTMGVLAEMMFGLGAGMFLGVYFICTYAKCLEGYFFAILFVLIGLMFTGVGILIFLYMKNYRVVFFPGGISYRNEFGKTRQYTDDQIENVLYFRHNVKIKTKDKLIGFNYNCTNYSWALDMVEKYRR